MTTKKAFENLLHIKIEPVINGLSVFRLNVDISAIFRFILIIKSVEIFRMELSLFILI